MGFKIFSFLESFGQTLTHGLFNDPWTSKSNKSGRLGNMYISEHGIRSGYSPHGGICQYHNIRDFCFTELTYTQCNTGHLHQRKNTFLMRAPPEAEKRIKGVFRLAASV